MADQETDVLARIASLEKQLEALKASVKTPARNAVTGQGLDQRLQELDDDDDGRAFVGVRSDVRIRAESLFDGLLTKRRLISYARAYELLFDEVPTRFLNAVHVPRVLGVAVRTAPRNVDGLEVRLDSLIVSIRGREPGAGHFRTATYSHSDWTRVFGSWTLIR